MNPPGSPTGAVPGRYAEAIEAELHRWLEGRSPTGRHYDLLAYHMGWRDEAFEPHVGPRGKRFRPLLCLLSCAAVGGDWQRALPTGAAIEFLHNFSLIHDDIEDGDEARHHRPALWKLSGEPLAINAGDAMLALAGLAALSASDVPEVACEFQETALQLTEGQYLDMTFETRSDVSIEEYFQMIALKTGALITYACRSGGRLGGGTADQIAALQNFGHDFGIAFQIFDDIRGIWAPSEQTGKPAAKDIANRKKSLPVLLALQNANGLDRERLSGYYVGGAQAESGEISQIIERLRIRRQVEDSMRTHLDRAFAALDSAPLDQDSCEELRTLATSLIGLN